MRPHPFIMDPNRETSCRYSNKGLGKNKAWTFLFIHGFGVSIEGGCWVWMTHMSHYIPIVPCLGHCNKLLSISMPPQKNRIIGCPRFFPQSSIPSKHLLTDWGWHLLHSNAWHSLTNSSLLVYNSYLLSGRIYQSSIPSKCLLTDWVTYYQVMSPDAHSY